MENRFELKGHSSFLMLERSKNKHHVFLTQPESNITSETDKKRSLSVYCCTCSSGWPVKAAYILSIFCKIKCSREKAKKVW